MKASAGGHSDVVKLLLSAGASLNEKDSVSCIIYNSMGRVIGSMMKNHQHISALFNISWSQTG